MIINKHEKKEQKGGGRRIIIRRRRKQKERTYSGIKKGIRATTKKKESK